MSLKLLVVEEEGEEGPSHLVRVSVGRRGAGLEVGVVGVEVGVDVGVVDAGVGFDVNVDIEVGAEVGELVVVDVDIE
jgi:hypothetical protein